MTHITLNSGLGGLLATIRRNLTTGLAWCAACLHRHRERRALSHLSDHMLRDIGVNRFDAQREANKPFWK